MYNAVPRLIKESWAKFVVNKFIDRLIYLRNSIIFDISVQRNQKNISKYEKLYFVYNGTCLCVV